MTYTNDETCIAITSVKETVHSSETNNGKDDENQIGAAIRRGMCMAQSSRCASVGTYKPFDPCDVTTWNEVTLREAQHQGEARRRGNSSGVRIRRTSKEESSFKKKMPSFISLGTVQQGQGQDSDQSLPVKINHGKKQRPEGKGHSSRRFTTTLSPPRQHTNGRSQHSESKCRPTGTHKSRSAFEARHQPPSGQRSLSRVMEDLNKKQESGAREAARETTQERIPSFPDDLPLISSSSNFDHHSSESQGPIMLNSEPIRTPAFSKSSSLSCIPFSTQQPDSSQNPARLSKSSSALDFYADKPDSLKILQKRNKAPHSRKTLSSTSLGNVQQDQLQESDQSPSVKVTRGRKLFPTLSPPRQHINGRSQHDDSESKCRPTGTHNNGSGGRVEGRHQPTHGQRSLSRVMEDLHEKQERAREMAKERTQERTRPSFPDALPLLSSLSNLDHSSSEIQRRLMFDSEPLRKSSSLSCIPSSTQQPDISQNPTRLSRSSSALDFCADEPDSVKKTPQKRNTSSRSRKTPSSAMSLGTMQVGQAQESDQSFPMKVNRGRKRHPQGEGRSIRRSSTTALSPPRQHTNDRSQHDSESKCRPTGTHKNRSALEGRHQPGQRSLSSVMEELSKKQERAQEKTRTFLDALPYSSSSSNLDHNRSEKRHLHARRIHNGSKSAPLLDAQQEDQEQDFPDTRGIEPNIHKSSSHNNLLHLPAEDKRFTTEGCCSPRTTSFVLDDVFLVDCGTQQDVQNGKGLSPSEAIALLMKPPIYTWLEL